MIKLNAKLKTAASSSSIIKRNIFPRQKMRRDDCGDRKGCGLNCLIFRGGGVDGAGAVGSAIPAVVGGNAEL